MAGQSNHPDIAIGRYRVSVYVGDRSVQRFRRAPSGEHASKGITPNRQQLIFIFVTKGDKKRSASIG
jgi:phage gp29-like protein